MAFFKRSSDDTSAESAFTQAKVLYDAGDYSCFDKIRSLAKKGHAQSQIILGNMYENGLGTMQDTESALKWFRQCPLPDDSSRKAIIESQLEGVSTDPSLDIYDLVRYTDGCNGADIVELCEQMKQSAINRSIDLDSDTETIGKADAEFSKPRTKCSVDKENLRRLQEFSNSGF